MLEDIIPIKNLSTVALKKKYSVRGVGSAS